MPGLGDAVAGALAGELDVAAGLVLAGVVLVGVVSAVVFSVTFPGVGNTAPVTALELGGLAGHVGAASLVWNIHTGKSVSQSVNELCKAANVKVRGNH